MLHTLSLPRKMFVIGGVAVVVGALCVVYATSRIDTSTVSSTVTPADISADDASVKATSTKDESSKATTASAPVAPSPTTTQDSGAGWDYRQIGSTVEVHDQSGWLATFTRGSRTVTVRGTERVFGEPATTSATVKHNVWVRMSDKPFEGSVPEDWLRQVQSSQANDILATAFQYINGSAAVYNDGMRIAGDADYGPLLENGSRQEGSDYNDYLGIAVTYGDAVEQPESRQRGALDCSGYVRMIWGYRHGLPLARATSDDGLYLPRRAVQMAQSAPGVMVIANAGKQVSDFGPLRPGDLVFQNISSDDGDDIDHVGIYLGKDSLGFERFISSRKTANGPTMGDAGGASRLDGNGLYARGFVAARRL